jgi:hypothetical protein
MSHILNLINQILVYSDPTATDNPHQRAFDHTRKFNTLAVNNPVSNALTLAPNETYTAFDGTIAHSISGTVDLQLQSAGDSIYRLTSVGANFKTARSLSAVNNCTVTINNNAMAVFEFTGATLNAQVGDILLIAGEETNDLAPFVFNPLNSGRWKIIGVNADKVTCTRLVGKSFSAVVETVTGAATDVEIFADDKAQVGHKIDISGTFSTVTQKTFEISAVAPDYIEFVSAQPLPIELGLTYQSNSITIYKSLKSLIYIEVDQESVIQLNGDTGNSNKLSPFSAGDANLPATFQKVGPCFRISITNKSVNPMQVKYFTVE